ncbi:MAG: hypothetical protein Q7U85_04545 [Rhodocyclaceae bacterium]|nr:hypothetical protein [Rhodocyclaceae bacterium]
MIATSVDIVSIPPIHKIVVVVLWFCALHQAKDITNRPGRGLRNAGAPFAAVPMLAAIRLRRPASADF